ncbi:3-keto-5-aminohexanoate cleavage protein [Methylobacterium variabile]|uniref:3-keto-5-aminohexanoate cleavage protein n=1 Tax=Methylobacterium variabile TaxID=298794 RepID=UPI003158A559
MNSHPNGRAGGSPITRPVIVTCAVTGSAPINARSRAPVSTQEIAEAALTAWREGAAIVHIHVRDPETGAPSGELRLYEDVVNRIKAANADVLINLTTGFGGRFLPSEEDPSRGGPGTSLMDPLKRCAHVVALKPDLCSLDMGSLNFGPTVFINTPAHIAAIAEAVLAAGVLPELEAFEVGHIRLSRHLIDKGVLPARSYFQLCLGIAWGSAATTRSMQFLADALPPDATWSAFGIADAQFPMAAQSVVLGGHVRVGMEDNLYLSRGVPATNETLVRRAAEIVTAIGYHVASPAEARSLLALPARP